MFSGNRLHVVGSGNTEYTYPIFDDRNDIPLGMTSIQYQLDDTTTGYIRALPQTQYPEPGLHYRNNNTIYTAFNNNTLNCNLQWHWSGRSDPYNTWTFICPDSATLDFGIHTTLEVVVLWHTLGIGWQSAVVGTIPAGATSVTMSGEYGGITWSSGGTTNLVTAWYFVVRSAVSYRQITGQCVYTMVSATITANVTLSEPLPAGQLKLQADWYGTNIPFHADFGPFDVISAGSQSGSSFVSFDAMILLGPTNYWTYLTYYPQTADAYGERDHAGRGWAPAGGGQFTDGFTLDVPIAASVDIGRTPEYPVNHSSSDVQYNVAIPEEYW